MTKKHYILYSIALLLCTFGVVFFIFSSVFFLMLGGLGEFVFRFMIVLPFSMAAILSFGFTKRALLTMGKEAVMPIFLWNAAVSILSVLSFTLWGMEIIVDVLFFAVIFYIIPCVACSASAILIYSKTTYLHGRLEKLSRVKRSLIAQFSLFFVPAILLVLYDIVATLVFSGISFGVQPQFYLTVVFASCVYAVGAAKREGKFLFVEFVVNVVFSVSSSILLYFYVIFINKGNHRILEYGNSIVFAIVMMILPPVFFAVSALIAYEANSNRIKEKLSRHLHQCGSDDEI